MGSATHHLFDGVGTMLRKDMDGVTHHVFVMLAIMPTVSYTSTPGHGIREFSVYMVKCTSDVSCQYGRKKLSVMPTVGGTVPAISGEPAVVRRIV